jgi:thiol reductant ABC exporter CydD subunit
MALPQPVVRSPQSDVVRRLRELARLSPAINATARAAVVGGALATVGMMVQLGALIDALLVDRTRPSRDLTPDFVWLAVFVLVRALCAGVGDWCGQRIATRAKAHLRRAFVEAVFARGARWNASRGGDGADGDLDDRRDPAIDRSGALVADALGGVETLDAYYRRYLPQQAAAVIVPAVVLVAVASLDLASAAILAVTGPLVVAFMWLIGARAEQHTRRQWRTLRHLAGQFLETLRGLPTALVFGRARDFVDRLDVSGDDYRRATMSVLRVAFLSALVLELAATVSTALVAVSVGIRLIEGWIAFRPGLLVLLLTPEFFAPLRQLGQRHHAGMEGVAAAERLFGWIEGAGTRPTTSGVIFNSCVPPENDTRRRKPQPTSPSPVSIDRQELTVRVAGVCFRYRDHESASFALAAIDVELRPRTLTALVGPSGAGKSTLVDVLLRFVEPDAGAIYANDRPIASLDPRAWRARVALVPQRPRFFDGSVLDNLRCGRPDASLEHAREAARLAEADAFIQRLPHGYDTSLGEMAGRASVGERQRLALARALLRDAPLLIVDEPSSSLDPVTEAAITRVITAESRRRTVLVVAHRLHTVQSADQLIVLERGRIVEVGRHEGLVRRNDVYARLVAAQLEVVT